MHSSYQLDGIGTIKSSSHLHISRTQELDKEYPSSQKCVGSYELNYPSMYVSEHKALTEALIVEIEYCSRIDNLIKCMFKNGNLSNFNSFNVERTIRT